MIPIGAEKDKLCFFAFFVVQRSPSRPVNIAEVEITHKALVTFPYT